MNCKFSLSGNVWRCGRCGYTSRRKYDTPPHKRCKRRRTTRGLGDWLAWLLAAVGITKRRAQAVARAMGKESCGCAERQEKLNEVGERLGL